jgi:hypothetical protein
MILATMCFADNQSLKRFLAKGVKRAGRKFGLCFMLQPKLAEKPRINAIRAVDRVEDWPPP